MGFLEPPTIEMIHMRAIPKARRLWNWGLEKQLRRDQRQTQTSRAWRTWSVELSAGTLLGSSSHTTAAMLCGRQLRRDGTSTGAEQINYSV